MRAAHQAIESVETYSPAEELFNRRRRTVGLFLGPVLFVVMLLAPLPGLTPKAHHLAAILVLSVIFWITEAVPAAVTAMLGPTLAVVMGVAPARAALAPFADPVIFLFIGSFILAEAMFVHGVDRRIAFAALASPAIGTSAPRILLVYGAVSTGLSMWMSNTATSAMMFPIGMSIAAHLTRTTTAPGGTPNRQFALGLMLITAFGASVGGIATPVGTPPNLIGMGMLERLAGVHISFFHWMALGFPLAIILFAFLYVYLYVTTTRGVALHAGDVTIVQEELQKLGPLTPGERNVFVAFGVTVVLWVAPGILALANLDKTAFAKSFAASVPESIAALVGALLLFVLPVHWRSRRFTITWAEAARIDWGTILLFGGGVALGELAFSTGLAEAMGKGLASWLPSQTSFALTALFTGLAIVLSETTSNTASATMILPIAIAVAQASGVRPIEPALGATLGASMGFMMPISTPPNAIVYSSGYVPITSMMRYGFALDVFGFFLITALVLFLGPIIF
jgi:sodium-dependent dicarboxylate transporter 2/3/5